MKKVQTLLETNLPSTLSIDNAIALFKKNGIENRIEQSYGLYLLNVDSKQIFDFFQSETPIIDDVLIELMDYDYKFVSDVFSNKLDMLHCLFVSFQNNVDVLNFYLPLFNLDDFDLSGLIQTNIVLPLEGKFDTTISFSNELVNKIIPFLKLTEHEEVQILKNIQNSFPIVLNKNLIITLKSESIIDDNIFNEISLNFMSITKSIMDYSDKILITSALVLGFSMSNALAGESSFDKKINQYNNLLTKTQSSLPKDCELHIEKIQYKSAGTFAVKATLGDEEFFLISEGFKTPTASKTTLKSGSKKINKCSSLSGNDSFVKMKKTIKESLEEL